MAHPETLPLNELRQGRKPGEKLPIVTVDDFTEVQLVEAPERWYEAPGMPYDDGLSNVKHGKAVELNDVQKEELKQAQMRGDRVRVAQLMKKWSDECP